MMSADTFERESRDENYFIPMTDILVGILFIFIIIIMAIMLNISDLETVNQDVLAKNARMLKQLDLLRDSNKKLELKNKTLSEIINELNAVIATLSADVDALKGQLQAEELAHSRDLEALQLQINNLLAQASHIRKSMLLKIRDRMRNLGYQVLVDADNGILRLADNVLFDSGAYELSSRGKQVLEVLARILEEILPEYTWIHEQNKLVCTHASCLEAIYVEGHTDKNPVSGNLKGGIRSNLQLSSARANETFQTFSAHPKLNSFVNGRGEKLLGVCGYGESRPVKMGDSEEDLKANRRIDLRFMMSPPTLKSLPLQQDVK